MLADLYSPALRARVFAIYNCGVYIGGGLGYICGALNTAVGWRWTLFAIAAPGVPLSACILWRVREPGRGASETSSHDSTTTTTPLYTTEQHVADYSVRQSLVMLCNAPFALLCLASSVRMFSGYALGSWMASFYERHYSLDSSQYGLPVGVIVMLGGCSGSLLGGWASDRLMRASPAAKAYVVAASQLLSAPCIAGVLMAPSPTVSYVLLFVAYGLPVIALSHVATHKTLQ